MIRRGFKIDVQIFVIRCPCNGKRQPIIGIGAPAGLFLKEIAAALHTDLILPDHYGVGNAVGAVAGSVMASEEVLVYPRLSREGFEVLGYYVQSGNGRQVFGEMGEALARARAIGRRRALREALRSGAHNPEVIINEWTEGLDSYRIRARALGSPRLTR